MKEKNYSRLFYYVLKRLRNATLALFRELFKPLSFLKGEDFEKCVRTKVFTSDRYDLVMKTHDFYENKKDYVESSLYPDYLFRDKETDKEFFVEVKYREKLYQDKLQWCNSNQFKRYQKYNSETPTIIAIGFGGRPKNPNQIYLVPLEDIKYNALYESFLKDYLWTGKRKNILDAVKDKVYN